MNDEAPQISDVESLSASLYAPPPRLEECLEQFWGDAGLFEVAPLRLDATTRGDGRTLKTLGPSPFDRGGFPLIGFLATVYDKVGRTADERLTNWERRRQDGSL